MTRPLLSQNAVWHSLVGAALIACLATSQVFHLKDAFAESLKPGLVCCKLGEGHFMSVIEGASDETFSDHKKMDASPSAYTSHFLESAT